jgi:uncharacterized protein (DUF1330 family)
MLKNAFMMTAGIIIGASAISALHAQSGVPYYLVAAINVKDQKAYEDTGVEKVRNAITGISGGKLIAGGYGKATVLDGTLDANRFLIFQFADKAALDKAWTEHIKPWQMSENVRKLADFNTISVEGVERK